MKFSIFIPDKLERNEAPPPVLYYLSGMSTSDDDIKTRGHLFQHAAKYGLAVVMPDTSARGVEIAGSDESDTLGSGAGFYVNAKTYKWKKHYNMDDYINKELPIVLNQLFSVDTSRAAIMGRDMGGHGALSQHFRNPGKYSSVSAFAPMCNPTNSPLGQKCFKAYLGSVEAGAEYDSTLLVSNYSGPKAPIMID